MEPPRPDRRPAGASAPVRPAVPGRFRLMRYFTLATLGVFIAVGLAVYLLQRKEERFFEEVQREQRAFFA